MQFCARDYAV